ncbi:MAG: exo-beta-N-acetylmuramidase NamZ family protein [Flavobacteriaceae bacterium]
MSLFFTIPHFKNTFLFWLLLVATIGMVRAQVIPGAENTASYLNKLRGKKIGLVAHQASIIKTPAGTKHLVDVFLENGITLQGVYAPEHGFRGTADAGEKIKDGKDAETGLSIYSLYGENRKPKPEQLQGIELMVFDLQDVGVRFFTYLSTLHYIMEACAEQGIPLLVLDRPNPNTHYIDGPVLEAAHKSFVGMHPVPIVYGMTIGEYAQMINGEKWLAKGLQCQLEVIPIKNYTHQTPYELQIRPSPNLPNAQAIALYPSLCLLEPTVISIGRGTDTQFQIYGHPDFKGYDYRFTPAPNFGSKNPKFNGELCFGKNLTEVPKPTQIELKWLIDAYSNFPDKTAFFLKGFERISGVYSLKTQLQAGKNETEIRQTWAKDLTEFHRIRTQYLIYP